jgi:hypothetical protein
MVGFLVLEEIVRSNRLAPMKGHIVLPVSDTLTHITNETNIESQPL